MNRCLFPWKLSSVFSTLGTFLKSCDKRIYHGFEKMQILKIVIALLRKLGKILQQKSLVYYALSNMLTSSKIFARTSSVIFARRKVVCRLNHSGTTVFFKENVRYPTWACGDPIRVPKTPQKTPGTISFKHVNYSCWPEVSLWIFLHFWFYAQSGPVLSKLVTSQPHSIF